MTSTDSTKSSAADGASTDAALVLEAYLSHLLAATPKLDAAAKNLIAVVLGAESARSETDNMINPGGSSGASSIATALRSPATSSSSSSTLATAAASTSSSPSLGKREEVRPEVALKCVRLILKAVSALKLPEAPQWGLENPQGEAQTFSERAEQLSHYKVCLVLLSRAQQSNTSPSKLLGLEFFQVTKCWPKVRAAVLASVPPDVPMAALETCLNLFESSLEGGADSDLIWAADFAAAVRRRREARSAGVKERVRVEELSDDDEVEEDEEESGVASYSTSSSAISSGGGAVSEEAAVQQLRDIISGVAETARRSSGEA